MKALLIFNPVAGQRDVVTDLERVIRFFASHGWETTLRKTRGEGDGITYAREAAAEGYDLVIAVGGDGTIGEVASGLVGSDCTLGVLPVGTGNIWAHMLGLPVWTPIYRDALLDAARIIVNGRRQDIDIGRANDRHFILWTGIGFDAKVTHEVEPYRNVRRTFGSLAYVVAALATTLGMRGSRITITIDGKAYRQRAVMVVVSNAQLYAAFNLAPQAQLDDGLLDVYVFKGVNMLDIFYHLYLLLSGKHTQATKVDTFRAKAVSIRADKPLPLHMDGDAHGYSPVDIEVLPKAIQVIVPDWASQSLFEQGEFDKEAPTLGARIATRLNYERSRLRQGRDRLYQEGERLYADWEYWFLHGTSPPPRDDPDPNDDQDDES